MPDCPSNIELQRLLTGDLADRAVASLREHLDNCPRCLSHLDGLSDDEELREWRRDRTAAVREIRAEAGVARLLGRLRAWSTWDAAAAETDQAGPGPDLVLAPSAHAGDLGVLGPYRVRRELGRGGMGIVLEAFDTELRRDAAIKVLRRDRADAQSRARFVREAQAAARVKHENVVTIHAVSNPPDALPYLVMELVRGPSLREKIAADQRIDPRDAARIIAETADGLAAAHDAGLVHRDIKPSNVLLEEKSEIRSTKSETNPKHEISKRASPTQVSDLGDSNFGFVSDFGFRDSNFRAKLSDFGLARITSLASSLTHDGTLAGTPAYMSPEQVRNPETIDPRADVYSLGVTLYESLTGEVPFGGAPHMVLRQIETDEPRPPRELNDAVPRDLETICLKAMEKDVVRRYQSAHEFGDDLRRWLRGEPIAARPVSRTERLWRWCRRNPRVAALSGAVVGLLALVAIGSTGGLIWVGGLQRETETQRQAAVTAGKQAESSALDATASQKLAEERLRLAIDSLNDLVFKVQTQLADTGGTLKVREQLLETAMAGLDRITKESASLSAADHSLAVAHQRIGDILWLSGKVADARSHYDKCRELAEARLAAEPGNVPARRDLAAAHEKTGVLDQHGYQIAPAREHYTKSLEIRESLVAESPDDAELQRELYASHTRLGDLAHITGDNDSALHHYERARQLQQTLADRGESDLVPAHDRVLTLRRLGWASLGLLRVDDARKYLIEALQLAESLAASDPSNATWWRDVGLIEHSLGILQLQQGEFAGAKNSFDRARGIIAELAAAEPNHAEMQYDLQLEHYSLGIVERAAGNLSEAAEWFRNQLAVLEPLAARNPTSLKFRNELYGAYYVLAELELRDGRFAETARWLDKAIAELQQLERAGHLTDATAQAGKRFIERARAACDMFPSALENPKIARSLPPDRIAPVLALRAYQLARLGRFSEAVADAEDVRARERDVADDFERSQCLVAIARTYAICARAMGKQSDVASGGSETDAVEKLIQKSLAAMRDAARLNSSHLGYYYLEPEFSIVRQTPEFHAMLTEVLSRNEASGK
jgi:serine/threonine protein kinase/tetratricopeptide (TPR) repeat protein